MPTHTCHLPSYKLMIDGAEGEEVYAYAYAHAHAYLPSAVLQADDRRR